MKQLFNFSFFTSFICVVLLTFAFVGATAFAQANTWNGLTNTNWSTAGNWSLGAVPTAANRAGTPRVNWIFSFAFFIFLRVFEPSWLKFLCNE